MKVSLLGLCLLAFLFALPTQTFAVDFTVNLTTDQHDANLADGVCDIGAGTGQCSLRAAVEQANNLPSNDRVLFNLPANSIITLTIANSGDIFIINSGTLDIIGTGANNLTINGGAGTNRIFTISGATVTISGITLTGGNGTSLVQSGSGGAIFAEQSSSLTLDRVIVMGNSSTADGGGGSFRNGTNLIINSSFSSNSTGSNGGGAYFNGGTNSITGSTFSNNSVTDNEGGGAFFFNGANSITGSTFSNNSAYLGGAYYSLGADGTDNIRNSTFSNNNAIGACGGIVCGDIYNGHTSTIINSTISGNTVNNGQGGGFCNGGNATLRNVTVTNNTAEQGGGIAQFGGTLNLGNTIIAGNIAIVGLPEIRYSGGVITSDGGNLVGDSPGDSVSTGVTIGYQPTDIRDTNPMLGALTIANGGTTQTHALLLGSPAIDKGLNSLAVDPSNGTALAFDQRGTPFFRIVDGDGNGTATVDIGAYELQARPTAASVSVAGRVTTANGRGINRALIKMTDGAGIVSTSYTNSFGYYSFDGVRVGQTVIFDVRAKRYNFTKPTQVISLDGNSSRVNFTAY